MSKEKVKPCVVGLGKLGLPLAAAIADAGFETFGLDKSQELVNQLLTGNYLSPEPGLVDLIKKNKHELIFVSDFEATKSSNIFFLIVPTPSLPDGKFNNEYLLGVISELLASWIGITGEKTIVIVSTVMPKTCAEVFLPFIRSWQSQTKTNLKINLLYSPEFIALGSVIHDLKNPDMILIGCEFPEQTNSFLEVMQQVTNGKPHTQILNLTEAEIVKLMVNCFVTMKISFANFIGEVSMALPGTNKYKISSALAMDSRIGEKYLRPGLGFAGPCFPRDNRALIAFAQEIGLNADLSSATIDINLRQPDNVVRYIKSNYATARSIAIAGITYKPHAKVVEESQTLMIARILKQNNFLVTLIDPLLNASDLPEFSILKTIDEHQTFDLVVVSKEFEFMLDVAKNQEQSILVI